ncbi:M3 family oligoendopeptidase, partial [Peribacillus sp. NPDC060186]
MKFNEYEYKRPEMDEIKSKFTKVLEKFRDAKDVDIQVKAMEEINEIRNYVGTMLNLVYIRHSIDTNDEFYKAENDYLDEFSPEMEELTSIFYTELVQSKFRREHELKWGKQ